MLGEVNKNPVKKFLIVYQVYLIYRKCSLRLHFLTFGSFKSHRRRFYESSNLRLFREPQSIKSDRREDFVLQQSGAYC
jgi:hypothetical protein